MEMRRARSLWLFMGEKMELGFDDGIRNDFQCCEFYNWYTVWVSHYDRKSVGVILRG